MNKKYFVTAIASLSAFGAGDIFNMSLDELLNMKVTISSKISEDIKESPSTVSVFTEKDIEQMGLRTLSQLLGHVPSFTVSNLGDRRALSVRGLRSYAQVLLLIDGQRANEAIFGGFYVTQNDISLDFAEKVEVIRGPGSSVYGSNAFLGVINIITKKDARFGKVEVGNQGQRSVALSFSKRVKDFNIMLATKLYKDEYEYRNYMDSYTTGAGTTIVTRTNKNTTEAKDHQDIILKVSKNNTFFNLHHSSRKFIGGTSADAIATSNNVNESKPSHTIAQLGNKFIVGDKKELDVKLGYAQATFNPFGYRGTKSGNEYYSGGITKERRYTFNSDFKVELEGDANFLTGIEFRNAELFEDQYISNFDNSGTYLGEVRNLGSIYPGPSVTNYGGFFQYKNNNFKLAKLSLGGRYDHNSIAGGSFNPRISINSQVLEKTTLRLNYGEAFRSPTYGELFQDSQVVAGNSSLKAEKIKTYELSLIQDFSRSRIMATYYISFFKNEISAFLNGSKYSFKNLDKSRREGVEIEISSKPLKSLTLKANYSYSYKLDVTDSTVPDYLSTGGVSLNYNLGRYNFNLSGLYKEKYKELKQDNIFVLNSKFTYVIDDSSNLYLQLENIGDKEYLNTTFMRTNHHSNRGRSMVIGSMLKF